MMIKFGTDGWRGIISDSFTFKNVRLASQGLADRINSNSKSNKKIALGFDRRFLSREFSVEVARVMISNGIEVMTAKDYMPTPVISWAAKNIGGLDGAVVITASHNPPYYNGFKFKENLGCSAFPETTKEIENNINKLLSEKIKTRSNMSFEDGISKGMISFFNPIEEYFSSLDKYADKNLLKTFKGKILVDPMNGSGSNHLAEILRSYGLDVTEIHAERDPLFRGHNPEPIELFLKDTISWALKNKPYLGIVLDGDSDRIGAIDENANFFNSQQIYSLIAWYFLKWENKRLALGKTVSTTRMIDRICDKFNVKLFEVPIGFKHLAKMMTDGKIFLGGEESGGIGFADHIPERDPILNSLILLNLISKEGKGLNAIYDDLCRNLGPAHFARIDYRINERIKESINSILTKSPPKEIAKKKVEEFSSLDGFKFIFNDSWLLIRTSGTEMVLRVYAEAQTREKALELIESARKRLKF